MRFMGVLLVALLLAGCSGKAADVDGIETTIERQAQRQTGEPTKVRCPDGIEWAAGSDFHCIANVGGQTLRITVTMENDDDWTWTSAG